MTSLSLLTGTTVYVCIVNVILHDDGEGCDSNDDGVENMLMLKMIKMMMMSAVLIMYRQKYVHSNDINNDNN